MLISYKINIICKEINEFALHGNLPSESKKKCNTITFITIWAFTLVYLIVDITITSYWVFGTDGQDKDELENFGFGNKCL